jgi:hypothetical protein
MLHVCPWILMDSATAAFWRRFSSWISGDGKLCSGGTQGLGHNNCGTSKKQRHNKGIFFKGILFILFKGIGEGLDGIPRKAQSMVK